MAKILLNSKSFRQIFCASNRLSSGKKYLSTSFCFCEEKSGSQSQVNPSADLSKRLGNYHPSKFEKYLLVWMKKYPSVAEVPKTVTEDQMEKVRNWARIKLNIILCVLTAIGCVVMVYSGKQAFKRGESLHKMNVEWHKEMKEKAK